MSEPSELRRCGRCHRTLPLDQFNWRRRQRNQRDNYCRPCRSAYKREHYLRNKDRYVEQAMRRRVSLAETRFEYLLEYFVEHPCADCGETDPMVLEFDHLRDKSFNVAKGVRDRAWKAFLEEIAKCDVVCANCHRRRTAFRAGYVRAAVAQRQSLALPRR